ncbi:hypothetical protein R3P38DRAFT_576407 [Favolaschia claudopus]|uniref:Uncharacterized protein n=1 Tax=Favolaschia claudopus TaxID=2862362 RepID=A0AAV9Z8X0_9AGAR
MEAVSLVRAWKTCAGARRVWEDVTSANGRMGSGKPSPASTAVQDWMYRRKGGACASEVEIRVVSYSLWLGVALALIRDSGGRRVGQEVLNQTSDRARGFGRGATSMRTFHLSSRSAVVASIPRAEMMLRLRSRSSQSCGSMSAHREIRWCGFEVEARERASERAWSCSGGIEGDGGPGRSRRDKVTLGKQTRFSAVLLQL